MPHETLAGPAQFTLEARKSRFIAHAMPVETIPLALAWLQEIADPQATHNCWAYRIGPDYRSSDDGEPGGSAGRPILAAIDGQGLDRVIVVVTRWYGGTNLGVGGLVRAYGGAAAECLRNAARHPLLDWCDASLECDFGLAGAVHGLFEPFTVQKLEESFDEHGLHLRLRLPASSYQGLAEKLRDISRGAARLQRIETDSA